MALADITRLPRNLQRLGEIAFVFARHGFGPLVGRLNLERHIPIVRRVVARPPRAVESISTEQRLVNAFQELGTTFVKFGQILSSRPDIVGEGLAEEFKRLRDQVQPFDTAAARRIVEEELKVGISDVFASFDETPGGSGSVAQVHRATLKDGRTVMVKVQRPGIESAIQADMTILRFVARLAEPQFPELRPTEIVDEFDRAIRSELDFTVEATNTARFHDLLGKGVGVSAPAVVWELTTPAVLTVERLEGVSIGNVAELERRGHDRRRLAKVLGECFMAQYFREGTFHADPHAGNLLVADDGTIGVIDFGVVGHLSSDVKARLTTVLIAAVSGDTDFIAEAAAELGVTGERFDFRQFRRDLTELYHKYRGLPMGRVDARRLFADVMRLARDNDVSLQRDLVLLGKSMAAVSSVTRALDPGYDVLRMAAPKTDELLTEKLAPGRLAKQAGLHALSVVSFLRDVPRDLRSILRKVESGQLQVGFRHRGLESALGELDRASNRLAISICVAALLVASSLLIRVNFLAVDWAGGVSVPGVLGYVIAGVLSAWLAWGILRSGRL